MAVSFKSPVFVALRAAFFSCAIVVFWVWLAVVVHGYDRYFPVSLPSWLAPVGFLLLALGGGLSLYCVVVFVVHGHGTPAPFDPPREFVAQGPYRFVRNPMYVGEICALLGAGIAFGSPSILLLAVGALIGVHLFVVYYEEPNLERRFGRSYLEYKAAVPRWPTRRPGRR